MSESDASASAERHWYGCEDVPGHSVQCLIQRVNDAPNSSSEQALVAHIAALEAELLTARAELQWLDQYFGYRATANNATAFEVDAHSRITKALHIEPGGAK